MLWTMLALAAAAPAPTDLTATYASPGAGPNTSMKVEVATNGNMRFEASGGITFIRREGHTYLVTGKGPAALVADVADFETIARESLAKSGPGFCASIPSPGPLASLVQEGIATVQGRTGEAWYRRTRDGKLAAKPEAVISHDPALAPIGVAVAEEYRADKRLMPDCPALHALVAPMEAVLASGVALAWEGMELTAVHAGPIDAKRFELPAAPKSLARLREVTSVDRKLQVLPSRAD